MIRRPPRSTRTDTLFPYTPLFRSEQSALKSARRGIKRDLLSFPALHLRSTPSLSSAPKRTRTLDTWKAGKPLRAAGGVGVASTFVLSMVVPNRKRDASRAMHLACLDRKSVV